MLMKAEYFPRLMTVDNFPFLNWRLCRVTLKLAVPPYSLLWSEKLLHTGRNTWSVFFNLLLILLVVQKLECVGQAHTETVWWSHMSPLDRKWVENMYGVWTLSCLMYLR